MRLSPSRARSIAPASLHLFCLWAVSELDYKPGRRQISIYNYSSHILGLNQKKSQPSPAHEFEVDRDIAAFTESVELPKAAIC
ncbi:hypothetical protein EMIT0P253_40080 [Pseudomonas sp. IT-P253]